ncbi:Choline-sulfatase [Maioricimonas rarisocia]|uniref:Choline-sulfatase n=1 Tax=Maioricimonas rarisocia TaxID=2528026 RepID=A0A517ZGA7_9PLAN|nr:sulfatase-like hydrolase/transferase [Maioricimonas rarisocia]QDU41510.1 Choline-sulfatase [Maioricimonas rarisocia]
MHDRSTPLNILWICSDQQRFDTIRSLGNSRIRTPNIDRLVENGVSFNQAYAQSPVCTPSRASFLTGRYPRTTRCRQNGQSIPEEERLVPRLLADRGYRCGLSGKLHLASCSDGKVEDRIDDGYHEFHWSHHPQPDWPENAYQQWLSAKGVRWEDLYAGPETGYVKEGVPAQYHQTTWCAEMAENFIRTHTDRPWLFSVNMFDPHHPFDPPAEYLRRYDPADMPSPKFRPGELEGKPSFQQLDHVWAHNTPGYIDVASLTDDDHRRLRAAYYAMVELIDDQVGRMVQALEETGQLDRTLVIFMSDHGEMLGDHGIYLKGPHFYDEAVRVPLMLSCPQRIESGLQSEALVELVDLAPTLMELAGYEATPGMQGKSLVPICTGQADPGHHRDFVYSEYYNSWTHSRAYGTMLRTRTEKIVVYHDSEPGELYDLERDPDEFVNLWDDPKATEMKLRMLRQAFDASVLSMDPLPERRGPF